MHIIINGTFELNVLRNYVVEIINKRIKETNISLAINEKQI